MSPFEKLTIQLMVATLCVTALGVLTAVFSVDFRNAFFSTWSRTKRSLIQLLVSRVPERRLLIVFLFSAASVMIFNTLISGRSQKLFHDLSERNHSSEAPRKDAPKQNHHSIKIIKGVRFILVPAGEASIGCSIDDDLCSRNELPLHKISAKNPFWMATTEVTTGQFEMCVSQGFCDALSNEPLVQHVGADRLPMTWVAAEDAQRFCRWLGGELPSETEWEYAARGRLSNCRYPQGRSLNPTEARYRTGSLIGVAEVGSFAPNGFGLYDMAGNVSELTLGPPASTGKPFVILRGGSYETGPDRLRVSARTLTDWGFVGAAIGFRCIIHAK